MLDKLKKLFSASEAEPSEKKETYTPFVPDLKFERSNTSMLEDMIVNQVPNNEPFVPEKIKTQHCFEFTGTLYNITQGIDRLINDGHEVTNISHASYYRVSPDGNKECHSAIVICKR